jgi:tRNA(fMet)-specific endonuclease VapC
MAGCLIDTNHLSAAIRPVSPLRTRIEQAHRQGIRLGTCIPVLCELESGIAHSSHAEDYRRQLRFLLKRVRVWPLEQETAQIYGELCADLRRQGKVLSQVDLMLAAMAKLRGLTILTTDRDFEALPDIRVENWVR